MLKQVQERCKLSPEYVILVLDDYTANMMNKLHINYYEFFKVHVYQVEYLSKSRKRYPMSDAVYFIHTSEESVKAVTADFPEEDKVDFDRYGNVHIVFTGPCPDTLLEMLCDAPKLAERVTSIFEANVDFEVFADNVFLLKDKMPL